MKWLIARLREPSTWAGLAGVLPSVVSLSSGPISSQAIGGIVAGVAAVLMREKGAA